MGYKYDWLLVCYMNIEGIVNYNESYNNYLNWSE